MPKKTTSKRTAKRMSTPKVTAKNGAGQASAKKVAKAAAKAVPAKKAAKQAPAKKVAEAVPAKKAAKQASAKKVAEAAPAKKATKKVAEAVPAKKATKQASAKAVPAKKAAKQASAKEVAEAVPAKRAAKQAPAKKVAKQASAKAVPAKQAAKQASAKKVAKATPAKQASAKKAAKQAPAKKVAKQASAKEVATRPAAAPAKELTKQVPAKAAASAGDFPTGWSARLAAKIAELRADPGVKVLTVWQGQAISAETIAAIEAKLGGPLDAGIRDFYRQANGLALVWVLADARVRVKLAPDGMPSMQELEELPPSAAVIALLPLEKVFGVNGAPFFDYAQFMPGKPPHWGFDFPGNFYTPAFVREGAQLRVKVGDDHGAAWDGKAVSFEQYLEGVLATWALVDARAEVFIHGKGRVPKPRTLAQAVADAQRLEP